MKAMAAEEDITSLLFPVFENGLTEDELDKLADLLTNGNFFGKADVELLRDSKGQEKIKVFFEATKKTKRSGLNIYLEAHIAGILGKPQIASIIQRCFDGENNQNILWILQSWNDLLPMKKAFQNISWMISEQEFSEDQWLLEFASSVATAEPDAETEKTMIDLLKKEMYQTPDSSLFSIVDPEYIPEAISISDSPQDFSREVEDRLVPLLAMLHCSVHRDAISAIVRSLHVLQHISANEFYKMNTDETVDFEHGAAAQFVNVFKLAAKKNWKNSLLAALKSTGNQVLCEVVEAYLLSPNDNLAWLLSNWNTLEKQRDLIENIAGQLKIFELIDSDSSNWLLCIIHGALTASNVTVMQQFTTFIQNALTQQVSSVNASDFNVPKLQAITRQYLKDNPPHKAVVDSSQSALQLNINRSRALSDPTISLYKDMSGDRRSFQHQVAISTFQLDRKSSNRDYVDLSGDRQSFQPQVETSNDLEQNKKQDLNNERNLKFQQDEKSPFKDCVAFSSKNPSTSNKPIPTPRKSSSSSLYRGSPTTPENNKPTPSPRRPHSKELAAVPERSKKERKISKESSLDSLSKQFQIPGRHAQLKNSTERVSIAKEKELTTMQRYSYAEHLQMEPHYQRAIPVDCGQGHLEASMNQQMAPDFHEDQKKGPIQHKGVMDSTQLSSQQIKDSLRNENVVQFSQPALPLGEGMDISDDEFADAPSEFHNEMTKPNNQSLLEREYDIIQDSELTESLQQDLEHALPYQVNKVNMSYAERVKRGIDSDAKQLSKDVIQPPVLSEKRIELDTSQQITIQDLKKKFTDYQTLVSNYRYMLEFRAKVVDFELKGNDRLCIYFLRLKCYIPMHRVEGSDMYIFMSENPTSQYKEHYKYVILRDGKELWEYLPVRFSTGSFRNRKCEINPDQRSFGHAVFFDIVVIEHADVASYESIYQKNFATFLPPCSSLLPAVDKDGRAAVDTFNLYDIYVQWFIAAKSSLQITQDYNPSVTLIAGGKKGTAVIKEYVQDIVDFFARLSDMNFVVKRILTILALAYAMGKSTISFKDDALKVGICNGLSLHDIDGEHQSLLLIHVVEFANQISWHRVVTRSSHPSNVFFEIFQQLSKVPEYILTLPINTLLLVALKDLPEDSFYPKPKLNAIKWVDLQEEFKKEANERSIRNMAEKIVLLSKRFPSVCKKYAEVVNLNTITTLLSTKPHCASIFDVNQFLKKLEYFWKELVSYRPTEKLGEDTAVVLSSNCLKCLQKLKSDNESGQAAIEVKQCLFWLKAATQLLYFLGVYVASHKQFSIACILCILPVIDSTLEITNSIVKANENFELKTKFKNVQACVLNSAVMMIKANYTKLSSNEVDFWNALSNQKWYDKRLEKEWFEACKDAILIAIPEKFNANAEALLEFYADQFDDMKPNELLSECFTDVVTKAVEKSLGTRAVFGKLRDRVSKYPHVLKVCGKVFKNQWNAFKGKKSEKESEADRFLDFLKTWTPAATFLSILSNPKFGSQLPKDILRTIRAMKETSSTLLQGLKSGRISMQQLQTLCQIQNLFWNAYEAMQKDLEGTSVDAVSSEMFETIVSCRHAELSAFYETKSLITRFLIGLSTSLDKDGITLDVQNLKEKLNRNINQADLSDLVHCKACKHGDVMSKDVYHDVTFFPLSEEERRILLHIRQTQATESRVIKRKMKQVAVDLNKKELTIHEVLKNVWTSAITQVLEIVQQIDDGTVKLYEITVMFGKFGKGGKVDIDEINEELTLLYNVRAHNTTGFDRRQLAKRMGQINNYFRLTQKLEIAEVLKLIQEKLQLEGNFEALVLPSQMKLKSGEKTLNSIDDDVFTVTKAFQNISQEQFMVLKQFADCGELIVWLKENMKSINEVKVLSDLAMISAGETPMEVKRVSCFLSAVLGFGPFLFDLPKHSGLKELLKACKQIWENVTRDDALLVNWSETSKQLEWLNYVKDFHGSVEESSLTRAQKINAEGVYIIKSETGQLIPNIQNCLKLHLDQTQKDKIVMNLSELHDLQSRLMLIAGEAQKGQQDVKKFIDVLSSVENLAKAYIRLRASGCLLFSDWCAVIKCSAAENAFQGVKVQVFFSQNCPAISSIEDTIDEVGRLTAVLYDALTQWITYLNEKRTEHYHLNHYNIHQLTYLCKQLAKTDVNDFPDQIYTLLTSVMEGVTYDSIVDCIDEVTRIDDVEQEISIIQDEDDGSKLQKKKKVVRKLVALEISENVSKAAVQAVKCLDVDECYLWALENETEEEKILELQQQFDEEIGFEARDANVAVVQNVINETSNLTLQQVIKRIQDSLQDDDNGTVETTIKTICNRYFLGTSTTSLNDCVSLEHVGQFLAMLGMAVDKDILPKRVPPSNFTSGKPNLVVCPQVDIWRTLLSIYMHSPEQPLPTATEVLICSESTTSEDVELLLRRAIQNPVDEGKRIFCLACADELSFDVAKTTEQTFQQLNQMQDKNREYQFVIITSSSHHYITTSFAEYQVENFPADAISAEDYLRKHLSAKCVRGETASKVDRDQSCVRVVFSEAAGMGKSLFVSRCHENLSAMFHGTVFWNSSTIRFLEKELDIDDIVTSLTLNESGAEVINSDPHFIHIDITRSVQRGVRKFLFDLIVLGTIQNGQGVLWRRNLKHFYIIEYTNPSSQVLASFTNTLKMFPSVTCLSPVEVQNLLNQPNPAVNQDQILMDEQLLRSEMYQRPYQYMLKFKKQLDLDEFKYEKPIENAVECLDILLKYCSIKAPSWLELSHFSKFLNIQLHDCERSSFCDPALVGEAADRINIRGFKQFVVRFMIRMSQDFATPSLNIAEGNVANSLDENDVFELHQLRRRWESGIHPYLFFNEDRFSMSFVHFNISNHGHLCHPKTKEIIQNNVMPEKLFNGLKFNRVNMQQDFDKLSRLEKLSTLCQVFGIKKVFDPDPTYELTTDNVLKMLAIHMRFRCNIPVVVMGETGCGKTRMVEFMSRLKAGENKIQNMVIVKVHGGITVAIIQDKVKEATNLAMKNGDLETILFLDEANTTEAIYAIKEIVCDGTVHGKTFTGAGLKIVAACNPYRKHTDDVIQALEKAGLGFNVKAEDATERFAGIPMRHLVYRVISLPPSMQPLVWDFGQLNDETEASYIRQMVNKLETDLAGDKDLPNISKEMKDTITNSLARSQYYMRQRRDVCSFVSLRDVERTIQSFTWFYKQLKMLNPKIEREKRKIKMSKPNISCAMRALIQALGMCYHATLDQRKEYREMMADEFTKTSREQITEKDILDDIIACQNVFINAIDLEKDIAKNEALRENVFMIVLCAEMRIPLFLVGKPGSSKSLAKTIVTDAMQGRNSRHDLFRRLKQIQVLSFQCSAISDAVGIETVFSQCAQLQKNQDLSKFVAVVVLDEIGLAEDSPKMPLKVLHPLLESASTTHSSLQIEPYSKVGFVGISNWALDPAKMNRGIFVTRGKPSEDDLHTTALAIFKSDKSKIEEVLGVIKAITDAYLGIYLKQKREFFGLRDYYGLLKMLFATLTKKRRLEFFDVATAVMRNFSGFSKDIFKVFYEHFRNVFPQVYDVNIPVTKLIASNLDSEFESRFLLLLTNQYSAVSLLPKVMGNVTDFLVIFGSSFPRDHDYTEVCRNINRIKVCMESGRAVVLLNLRDLYESLYDALNQHYVTFAGERYVDLGLGGHRVKCRVKTGFRLIVIEEKEVVYEEFPIPLINRLEKHVFETRSVLNEQQITLVERLREWMMTFSKISVLRYQQRPFTKEDTFAGCKEDTPASALLILNDQKQLSEEELLASAQEMLLQTAALDGVCRLLKSDLKHDAEKFRKIYMDNQQHDSLWMLLRQEMAQIKKQVSVFEITSFSQVLNEKSRQELEVILKLPKNRIMLITLQQFKTEQEYSRRLEEFFEFAVQHYHMVSASHAVTTDILLIQCPQAHLHGNLIACAKYSAMNKVKQFKLAHSQLDFKIIIGFLFTLERRTTSNDTTMSYTSFHSHDCLSVYVDELKPGHDNIVPVSTIWNMSMADVLERSLNFGDGSNNRFVDVCRLLKESIPEAMGKLRTQEMGQGRNRIRILFSLCFESECSDKFLDIVLKLVHRLLRDRDQKQNSSVNWIDEEACSSQALQEGGSFRNTLWLRLRKIVALALAKIISMADVDNNLDIIANLTEEHRNFANIWLYMFRSKHVCDYQWMDVSHGADFFVQRRSTFSCKFPFFRAVNDVLCLQWKMVLERNTENNVNAFITRIKSSDLQDILDRASEEAGKIAIKCFTHDLICLLYKSQANDNNHGLEYEVVEDCMLELFKAQRNQNSDRCNVLVEIFIIFMENHSKLSQLAEVIAVHSDILNQRQSWVEKQSASCEFISDRLAFCSLLQKLENDAPNNIGKYESCKQWKLLVAKTKCIAEKLINEIDGDNKRIWKQIVFVEIFLEQLIPISVNQKRIQQYLTALAPLARRLWIGASKLKDLSDLQFLNIITKTLQGCTKDIKLRLLCSWGDLRCKSCRADKINQPVLLPCEDYICKKCVPLTADSFCPVCRHKITQPDKLQPLKLSPEQNKEFETFESACTSFFLEYLSTFCFPPPGVDRMEMNRQPPDEKITDALEKLVICDNTTKNMTPLHSGFDNNPTARSYILQLLLRCDAELVQHQLNQHFKAMEMVLNDKELLMEMYIGCIQDILQRRFAFQGNKTTFNVEYPLKVLQDCIGMSNQSNNFSQVQHLNLCARLQFIARVSIPFIVKLASDKTSNFIDYQQLILFMKEVCNVCKDKTYTVMKRYIVKQLCRSEGMDAFNILLKDTAYRCLIPTNLIPKDGNDKESIYLQSDLFTLSGKSYIRTKTLLLDVAQTDDFPQLFDRIVHEIQQSTDSIIQILLALSVWAASGNIERKLRQEAYEYMVGRLHMHLTGNINQQFFSDIASQRLGLVYENISPLMQYKFRELINMVGVTLLNNSKGLLKDLSGLITNPEQYEHVFLPTMPASNFFEVRKIIQQERSHNTSPKAFQCPNGHVYFIGECTNPVQAGICPECRMPIGGKKYGLLQDGNIVGDLTEKSQAGYKLGPADQRPATTPERKLTKLSVCTTRIILHVAMLLGANNGNAIKRLIKIQGDQNNVIAFLMNHIQKDFADLATFLGRSPDDSFVILHQILHKMRLMNLKRQQQNYHFKTMAAREIWEEEFQRQCLSLIFKDVDAVVNNAQNILINAGKFADKPLHRLVYDLEQDKGILDGVVKWDCPRLWKYHIHIDMKHLRQRLEAVDSTAGGEGAALKTILSVENLDLIQHLYTILHFQEMLITRYHQKIDMAQSDDISIQTFLEEDECIFAGAVVTYIEVWNEIKHLLAAIDRYNTPRCFFEENLTPDSPISMFLPSKRGRGCCALVLAEYIANKQNDLLQTCRECITPRPEFPIVDVPQLLPRNLVCINENRDLMPLVLANSQYETTVDESGPHYSISYNIGLLEKKVMEKFVLRKAIIKLETIPLMQYPLDMGLGQDFLAVQKCHEQVSLPVRMCQEIDAAVEAAMTVHVCEAVRTLTLVIQFLTKLGGEADLSICDYAERDLLLPSDETEMIPRSAQIRHCLALYERLSWHRSRRLASNGQNPFENALANAEDIENEEVIKKLCEELNQMNIQRLQIELNALIMFGPELDPDWRLSEDALLPYLELKHDGDNSWCEKIPEEVLFKNAVHVFLISMDYLLPNA